MLALIPQFQSPRGPGGVLIALSASVNNVNLFALAGSPVEPATFNVIIDPGVIIGSSSTASPAMDIGSFVSGTIINIINKGRIQGAGGDGSWGYDAGLPGGDALYATVPIIINNNSGQIWSGGGGGGGSPNFTVYNSYPASGGGGAGTVPGWGSPPVGPADNPGTNMDGSGTSEAGGIPGYFKGFQPGIGGDPGQPGGAGTGNEIATAGGLAGNAINGLSNVTWSTGSQEGSVLGSIV